MAVQEFLAMFAMCAPQVHPLTMQAIVSAESDYKVYALNVNGAETQPLPQSNRKDATALLKNLLAEGKSVDVGLAQINSKNFEWVGLTPENAFDPCPNISAAAQILTANYESAAKRLPSEEALRAALSAYNTGNETRGITNGYVSRVESRANYIVPAIGESNAEEPTNAPVKAVRLGKKNTNESSWSTFQRRGDRPWDVYDRK